MKKDLAQLSRKVYDVLVIGGGIYGVWIAWDATLRGLSVALVEKGDFGSGTSSNSLKIVHGGLRYLQQADFRRMRESVRERTTLMRVAPHLIHPLPFLIPTYGYGLRGKEILSLALFANDLISFDRNRLLDPQKYLPRGRVISREECRRLLPGINQRGLTGGAMWYDCQLDNSERMLLCILRSATQAGADVANYTEVTGVLTVRDRVTGVTATDLLTEEALDIRAKIVVNASGPSVQNVLSSILRRQQRGFSFSKALNFVLTRQLFPTYGVGVSSKKNKDNTGLETGGQWFFIVPWRDRSLVGTLHLPYEGEPDAFQVTEQDVMRLLAEVNAAYPLAALTRDDIAFVHGGLLPANGSNNRTGNVALLKQYQIIDHAREGNDGVMTVVGVKYTTARDVAQRVVDRVCQKLGREGSRCMTAVRPVYGGQLECFSDSLREEVARRPYGLSEPFVRRLVCSYGSAYAEVLQYLDENPEWRHPVAHSSVLQAEVVYGVRAEMAQRLTDVIFRRTDLGAAGNPGRESIQVCAALMRAELGWDVERTRREEAMVYAALAAHHAKTTTPDRYVDQTRHTDTVSVSLD